MKKMKTTDLRNLTKRRLVMNSFHLVALFYLWINDRVQYELFNLLKNSSKLCNFYFFNYRKIYT